MKNFLLILFALFAIISPQNTCGQTQRDSSDNIVLEQLYASATNRLQNNEFDYRTYNKSSLSKQRARQSINLGLISVVGLNLINSSLANKYDWNLWVDVPAVVVASVATMVPFVIWYKRYSGESIADILSSLPPSPPDTTKSEMINDILRHCSAQYGTNSVEYGRWMMACATICIDEYDLKQAEELLNKGVLVIRQYGNGPFDGRDTADEIFMQDIMDYIEQGCGRDYYALRHCKRSTELKRQYFGPDSKVYLSGLIEQSRLEAQRFHYRQSMKTHNEGYEAYVKLIKDEFCQRGENARTSYWQTAKNYIYATVDLAAQTSGQQATSRNRPLAGPAYNALLLYKGLLLNTAVGFENHVKNSGIKSAIDLLEKKKKLAANNEPYSVLDSIDLVILQHLQDEGNPYTIPSLDITWDSVQMALGNDDLAIEFFRDRANNYGAVLLRKNWKSPQIVMLDNVLDIDNEYISLDEALIRHMQKKRQLNYLYYLKSICTTPEDAMNIQMQIDSMFDADKVNLWHLGRAIWTDEIVKYFPHTTKGRIFFSADGELQVNGIENMPFLPIKGFVSKGDYPTISDVYSVHRLSSTRELVLQRQDTTSYRAAVFGGIKYDLPKKSGIENFRKHRKKSWKTVMQSNRRSTFDYLPGTKEEADVVSDMLGKSMKNTLEVHKFMDEYGTEEEFKGLSNKKYRIIHVATHGFALNDGNALFIAEADTNNPLARSGLLLAGGNAGWNGTAQKGKEDGVLTALEISRMDLHSTDLVVLSACETGLGSIGEDGVFGLQRGFKMAGTGAILMSLWQVDDNATCFLMTEFYRNWLNGMNKHDSFEKAKRQVRAQHGWESPWLWAAFIMLDAVD